MVLVRHCRIDLQSLNLKETVVTDAGLKELAPSRACAPLIFPALR